MSSLLRLPLQDLALAPSSLRAYTKQLDTFLRYRDWTHQQLIDASPERLDRRLAEFIQYSYDRGSPFAYASHSLHAIIYFRPSLKHGGLPLSRQCLKGWDRVKQSKSHPPITWELTVVIACTLAQSGYHAPAVSLLVGFDCYLRVSELTGLRLCDIVMPSDPRMGQAHIDMAVCLPKTKTGPNQSVSVQNPDVAQILYAWIHHLPSTHKLTDRIFSFSPAWLGRLMHNTCVALGVGHIPYVPHSLRHGGATSDFLRTRSVEHVHFRGRWKSIESVRTYIQTARALLAAQSIPSHLNELGIQLSDSVVAAMSHSLSTVPEVVTRANRRVTFRE